jgi:hypothetical protein
MPANLNALIRYKTINSCLYGGRSRWTIKELMDACSEALAETRGRYNSISERTIRDDFRIMRSDILGFNAPIIQERGLYFYSDPEYSIHNLRITDAGLADKIYIFLLGLRSEMKHPEIEIILKQLCQLTKREYEKPIIIEDRESEDDSGRYLFRICSDDDISTETDPSLSKSNKFRIGEQAPIVKEEETAYVQQGNLSWGKILEKIYLNL